MKSNISFLGLFLAVLVLVPGCMHVPTYKRQSLQSVSDYCAYHNAENNVIMQAKLLSREDKKSFFGKRSALIHDKDIQVLYLSIHNLSDMHYVLSPVDVHVPMISYNEVIKLMKTSSTGRLIGGVIDGVLAYSFGTTAMFTIGDLGISNFLCAAACLTPSIVCGGMALMFFGSSIKSIIMNKRIRKDIAEKTLHKKIIIDSGEQYDGLIFVSSPDYTPQFTVTMHEKNNAKNSITFDVDLRQHKSHV